jgi:flagellin
MPSVLNTNRASILAANSLSEAQTNMANTVERLSSGLRVNRAKDDAAGLSISSVLTQQINGANQGYRNINDAISVVQTAEGALSAASDMAQRILTLATQGASATASIEARVSMKTEMQQLILAINKISSRTNFAGVTLLDKGTAANSTKFTIQVSAVSGDTVALNDAAFKSVGSGATTYTALNATTHDATLTSGQTIYSKAGDIYIAHIYTKNGAGADDTSMVNGVITTGANLAANYFSASDGGTGQANALSTAVEAIVSGAPTDAHFTSVLTSATSYISALNTQRTLLGSYQNNLEFTAQNVLELSSNSSAARSRIMDTDYAAETASLTKGQILQQAATAMLAQANQMPNVILSLLK